MPNLIGWTAGCPADTTINVLPSKLVATVAELLIQSPGSAIQAHAGNGIIGIVRPPGKSPCSAAASSPQDADDSGVPTPEVRVMRAIKERFDPANVLNPGVLFA